MKKMKKMKKQFLSLFVLLCMIISMFPTTALAANIIDVSGNVTITRSDEELTCADNITFTILTIPTISLRGLKAVKDQARFRAGRERINVIRRW